MRNERQMIERSPDWHAGYDIGHDEGESCHHADWTFALEEFTELPEGVEAWPNQIAELLEAHRWLLAEARWWAQDEREARADFFNSEVASSAAQVHKWWEVQDPFPWTRDGEPTQEK